ncbi:Sec7 domain-containing protein, partial [Hamiltosporidium tvaerminnensis]
YSGYDNISNRDIDNHSNRYIDNNNNYYISNRYIDNNYISNRYNNNYIGNIDNNRIIYNNLTNTISDIHCVKLYFYNNDSISNYLLSYLTPLNTYLLYNNILISNCLLPVNLYPFILLYFDLNYLFKNICFDVFINDISNNTIDTFVRVINDIKEGYRRCSGGYMYVGGVNDSSMYVGGVNDSSMVEGNNNMIGGVNYKDNKQHPVNYKDKEQHPVNYKDKEQHPVIDSNNTLHPVIDSNKEQHPVNYKDNKQHPVIDINNEQNPVNHCTDEQHPLNHCTNEQHPLNHCTNEQHPLNHCTNEQPPVNYSTNTLNPVNTNLNKQHPVNHTTNNISLHYTNIHLLTNNKNNFLLKIHIFNKTCSLEKANLSIKKETFLFLRYSYITDLKVLGNYISGEGNLEALKVFMSTFVFHGYDILSCIRKVLFSFVMPGESQKVIRVLEAFSSKYYEDNKVEIGLDKELEGDNSDVLKGDKSDMLEGDKDQDSKLHPVSNKDVKQHPLSNSTSEQHPLSNSTSEQHPVTDKDSKLHPTTPTNNNNTTPFTLHDIYILSYAIIMLNTNLHNINVKIKISKESFIESIRNCNITPYYNNEYLLSLYNSIKDKGLVFNDSNCMGVSNYEVYKELTGYYSSRDSVRVCKGCYGNRGCYSNNTSKDKYSTEKYSNNTSKDKDSKDNYSNNTSNDKYSNNTCKDKDSGNTSNDKYRNNTFTCINTLYNTSVNNNTPITIGSDINTLLSKCSISKDIGKDIGNTPINNNTVNNTHIAISANSNTPINNTPISISTINNTPLNNNTVNNTTPISLSYTLCPFYIISSYTYIINNTYKSITPIIPYHISCYYIEICKYLHLIEPLIYYLEYISKYLDVKIEEIIDIFIEIVQDIDKWYGDSIGVGVGGFSNLSDEQQGVSDRGSNIKGVNNLSDEQQGVRDRGSNIKGVSNMDSNIKGVGDMDNVLEGVSNMDSNIKGVGDMDNVLEGVGDMDSKQQGVNITSNKQQGVSNNTDEQHPFNNTTNEQHPFNNTTTNITTTNHSQLLTLLSLPLNILYTLYTKCKKKEHFISKYENVYNKYIRITSSLPDKYYILLIKYIVYNDSSDKGDSTNTLHPVNAGTNNYNPVNTSTNNYNPFNTGTNDYNPLNIVTNDYNPLNTSTNALPPVNTSTNNYNPLNNNTANNTPLTTQHTNNTPSILLSNNTFYLWFLFLIIDRNCFRIKGVLNEVCIIFKGNINYMSYLIEKVVELRLTGVLCTFIKEWRLSVISVLDKCVKEDSECIDSSVIDVIERYIFKYCSVEECMLEGDRVVEGVSAKSMLEGVNHKSSNIEGVRDKSMLEGVSDRGSNIKGVGDTTDEQQGVNDKGKEEGVNHKGSDIKGVNDTTDEQQGVSDRGSNIKGVNICTNTQHPVNNNTNTQHPVNNNTDIQHPFNNTDLHLCFNFVLNLQYKYDMFKYVVIKGCYYNYTYIMGYKNKRYFIERFDVCLKDIRNVFLFFMKCNSVMNNKVVERYFMRRGDSVNTSKSSKDLSNINSTTSVSSNIDNTTSVSSKDLGSFNNTFCGTIEPSTINNTSYDTRNVTNTPLNDSTVNNTPLNNTTVNNTPLNITPSLCPIDDLLFTDLEERICYMLYKVDTINNTKLSRYVLWIVNLISSSLPLFLRVFKNNLEYFKNMNSNSLMSICKIFSSRVCKVMDGEIVCVEWCNKEHKDVYEEVYEVVDVYVSNGVVGKECFTFIGKEREGEGKEKVDGKKKDSESKDSIVEDNSIIKDNSIVQDNDILKDNDIVKDIVKDNKVKDVKGDDNDNNSVDNEVYNL